MIRKNENDSENVVKYENCLENRGSHPSLPFNVEFVEIEEEKHDDEWCYSERETEDPLAVDCDKDSKSIKDEKENDDYCVKSDLIISDCEGLTTYPPEEFVKVVSEDEGSVIEIPPEEDNCHEVVKCECDVKTTEDSPENEYLLVGVSPEGEFILEEVAPVPKKSIAEVVKCENDIDSVAEEDDGYCVKSELIISDYEGLTTYPPEEFNEEVVPEDEDSIEEVTTVEDSPENEYLLVRVSHKGENFLGKIPRNPEASVVSVAGKLKEGVECINQMENKSTVVLKNSIQNSGQSGSNGLINVFRNSKNGTNTIQAFNKTSWFNTHKPTPHKCNLCHLEFFDEACLKSHFMLIHSIAYPRKCYLFDKQLRPRNPQKQHHSASEDEEEIDVVSLPKRSRNSRSSNTSSNHSSSTALPINPSRRRAFLKDLEEIQEIATSKLLSASRSGSCKLRSKKTTRPRSNYSRKKRLPPGSEEFKLSTILKKKPRKNYKSRNLRRFESDSESSSREKRDQHNIKERMRRVDMRTSIEKLRVLIPNLTYKEKVPTIDILHEAASFCTFLKSNGRELVSQVAALRKEQKQLQATILALKR